MFSIESDTDVVMCPYNKAHRMLRNRLQPHLIKCRKYYPSSELQKCPFNVTHLIPEPEFSLHVTNCSDRKLITQYMYDAPQPKEEDHIRHAPVESEENWDDTEVEDYNPLKYIDRKVVLRLPLGVHPAERKEFIKRERKRLGDEESDSDSNHGDNVKPAIKKEDPLSEDDQSVEDKQWLQIIRSRSKSRSRSPHNKRDYEPNSRSPHIAPPYRRQCSGEGSIVYNSRDSPPKLYNIDDDPYYSRDISSSRRTNNVKHAGRRSRHEAELNLNNTCDQPPLISYPTRMPSYGRGAYRGYPYGRSNCAPY